MSGNNVGRRRIISNYGDSVGIRKTNRSLFNKNARGHCVQNCVRIYEKIGGKFVTETWLVDHVPDEAVDCSGQNIIRKDRSNGKGGKEIAVYVNDRIPIKLRDDLNDSPTNECG